MTTGSTQRSRPRLTRERVLRAAVDFIDLHGLDALSMHRLGAELDVRAMSLYKYVCGKDDVLDGVVDVLWSEIPVEPRTRDWRETVRALAEELRALVRRHPHAGSLLTSRKTLPEPALRVCDAHLRVMRDDGVPEQCAVALLRSAVTYGIGHALAELSFPESGAADDDVSRFRRTAALLPRDAPDNLVRTAMLLCSDCDMDAEFAIGLDLMIQGLDAYLRTRRPEATAPADS
ncbi:TetR family transcriptional regulator [Nocardiopsis gilva YIM 90087]|uniref:TetR family transcriptional regulator n=2 Tax=Nocardiopsis gilva TaxID=280236 RepID=A0A223SCM1_9ACTN|nr:TetR/AcrR family transcriptional regulator C-terminal domain-containing protein [Nocardiopsis gilva]ASU85835.1 TetR family transcriptional regulator [Nocardiopsis gilva YIM 90087]